MRRHSVKEKYLSFHFFFIQLTALSTSFNVDIPVDSIIFLFFNAIYFSNAKLFKSPEPILYIFTPIFSNKSTLLLSNGVEIKSSFI